MLFRPWKLKEFKLRFHQNLQKYSNSIFTSSSKNSTIFSFCNIHALICDIKRQNTSKSSFIFFQFIDPENFLQVLTLGELSFIINQNEDKTQRNIID